MSIWPQAMSYLRPSSEVDLVRPVMACLVAVYGAEFGRGACAEIEPLLMIRPPRGCWLLHDPECFLRAQKRAGEIRVDHRLPLFVSQILERAADRHASIVEQQIEPAESFFRLRKKLANGGGIGDIRRHDEALAMACVTSSATASSVSLRRPARTEKPSPSQAKRYCDVLGIPLPAPVTIAIFDDGRDDR